MKIVIIMNNNSYPGREYLYALINNHIKVEVISIGNYPEINSIENNRCNGLWNPPAEVDLTKNLKAYKFNSLNDSTLVEHLKKYKYDLGIQGGPGIIKKNVLNEFKYGIINFHPGDLPEYRGCSAPEWQLQDKKNIISTAHLLDEGIDSGPIIIKKILNVNMKSYYHFRASIYPQTAIFIVEVVKEIILNSGFKSSPKNQKNEFAIYRNYIGDEVIERLKLCFNSTKPFIIK